MSKKRIKKITFKTAIILICLFFYPHIAYFSNLSEESVIHASNQARLEAGLKPVTANQFLTQAAYLKAEAIFESQEFSHTINNERFSYWVKQTEYEYEIIGENLAIDFLSSEGAIAAWMQSPTHRANLLNPKFSEIGVAVKNGVMDGQKSIVIVQIFGAPRISLNIGKKAETGWENSKPVINHENKPLYVNYNLKPLIKDFISHSTRDNGIYTKFFSGHFKNSEYFFYINYYILSILLLMVALVAILIIKQQKPKK